MKQKRIEVSGYLFADSFIPSSDEAYFAILNGQRNNLALATRLKAYKSDDDGEYRVGVIQASNPVLLLKRFLSINPMHLLHDEVLPGLATILYHKRLREKTTDRLIVTLDDFEATPLDDMMTWLGQYWSMNTLQARLRMKNGLKPDEHLDYVCFREAYIGLDSPSVSWYHYGFEVPQGPIEAVDRELVGSNLRAAAEWVKDEILGKGYKLVEAEVVEMLQSMKDKRRGRKQPVITIISRRKNRLILNEEELQRSIGKAFPTVRVQFIRHETDGIEDLIAEVADSVVLIGMHGALMSLVAFLPPGAAVIEMFPYGIPAENYTPYKTLTGLPAMKIKYAAWVNPRKEVPFNVGHEERDHVEGGLKNYPASYREGIKATERVPVHGCCYSPFWLYRIFQDTHVQADAIVKLIRSML